MIDQPSWPIQEYLDLRDRLRDLPPEQQEAEIAEFFETHPQGAGLRTYLGTQTFPQLRLIPTMRSACATSRDVSVLA